MIQQHWGSLLAELINYYVLITLQYFTMYYATTLEPFQLAYESHITRMCNYRFSCNDRQ